MIPVAQGALLALLLLLAWLMIHGILTSVGRIANRRRRVFRMRERGLDRFGRGAWRRMPKLERHLREMLASAQSPWTVSWLFLLSAAGAFSGVLAGFLLFHSFKGMTFMTVFGGSLPYAAVRMRLIGMRMRTRLDFLPAVEVFYQALVLAGHGNVRSVLHDAVQGTRMPYPIQSVFEQLDRNLTLSGDVEESLSVFRLALGHPWADYFAGMLRYAMAEGSDAAPGMRELIRDMRRAQRADQLARNRLLEIRLANFSPLLFLGAFLAVNFRLNPQTAYQYYIADPQGRDMLLDSLILTFASFLMGLYLSMKRM